MDLNDSFVVPGSEAVQAGLNFTKCFIDLDKFLKDSNCGIEVVFEGQSFELDRDKIRNLLLSLRK